MHYIPRYPINACPDLELGINHQMSIHPTQSLKPLERVTSPAWLLVDTSNQVLTANEKETRTLHAQICRCWAPSVHLSTETYTIAARDWFGVHRLVVVPCSSPVSMTSPRQRQPNKSGCTTYIHTYMQVSTNAMQPGPTKLKRLIY
jgi:hypothetical protein